MLIDTITKIAIVIIALGGGGMQIICCLRYQDEPRRYINHTWSWLRDLVVAPSMLVYIFYLFKPNAIEFAVITVAISIKLIGIGIVIAGFMLWVWSQLTLGRNWCGVIAVRKHHTLTVNGPYRWVRHPMYTAFILMSVGLLIAATNLLFCIPMIAFILLTADRVNVEDLYMGMTFGDQHARWCQQTGRLLPRIFRAANM